MAKILELTARLGFDGNKFKKGMDDAKSQSKNLKQSLASAFATIGISALVRETVRYAGEIGDLADRLDIIPEKLQEMQYWATQNAASVDDLSASFENLEKARKAALEGDQGKIAAFERMGISQGQIGSMTTPEMFSRINKSSMSRGQAESRADLMEIFGKSAGKMSAAFQSDMEAMAEKAREVGAVMSNDVVIQLAALDDSMAGLAMTMKSSLAPAIVFVTEAVRDLVAKFAALGSFFGGAAGSGAVNAGAQAIAKSRASASSFAKSNPKLGALAKYSGFNFLSENFAALQAGVGTAFGTGLDAAGRPLEARETQRTGEASARQSKLSEVAARAKARELAGYASQITGLMNAPAMIDLSGAKTVKEGGYKNQIDSDALAKIGGFVGGGGGTNYQKQTAEEIAKLLTLFKVTGAVVKIKDESA